MPQKGVVMAQITLKNLVLEKLGANIHWAFARVEEFLTSSEKNALKKALTKGHTNKCVQNLLEVDSRLRAIARRICGQSGWFYRGSNYDPRKGDMGEGRVYALLEKTLLKQGSLKKYDDGIILPQYF
jgi:hypothetical protein